MTGPHVNFTLSAYAWTLTFGGRPALPNEIRIQMTGVESPLELPAGGPTVLIGYEPELNLFAGFDLDRHRKFSGRSPSVQIDREELRAAENHGLSFHRKENDEIAVGVRPDMFMAYVTNARLLHQHGSEANVLRLLNNAVHQRPLQERELDALPSQERRRVVADVSRWSRDAGFNRRVLFAYGNRCAVTRVQLRLVDAAHILPVGALGSVDLVQNGIALAPTYHRAFDAGLIYLDEQYRMRISNGRLQLLEGLNLTGGIQTFAAHLGEIFLPPDVAQRPRAEFIRKANTLRQIST